MSEAAGAPAPEEEETNSLPTIFDPATCTRKGLCPIPVSGLGNDRQSLEGRRHSHSIYFEQHGSGPEKIVFIMGLNNSSFGWEPQVASFGRDERYSVLVFDNRGVGNSGSPGGRFTTSAMARDVVVLLDHVGWTDARSVHVVGRSLGGMVALELASAVPERVVSLVLAVTSPGGSVWSNVPPWRGLVSIIRATLTKDLETKLPLILESAFPIPWLDSRAPDDPAGRTNRAVQTAEYRRRTSATRPQPLASKLAQLAAALTHHVAPARLRALDALVPHVLVLSAALDALVDPRDSARMGGYMGSARGVRWEDAGHAVHLQWAERFGALVEGAVEEGRRRVGGSA